MAFKSTSPNATKKLGGRLARKLAKKHSRTSGALVIGLVGNLGAVKTTFIQSFARELGIKRRLTSPTFVIMRSYRLPNQSRITNYQLLYHVDAYRIKNAKEIKSLGFDEIMNDPKNIILIEWADKIKKILPKETIWINFNHGKKESERIIKIF